ncbi:hypothetical protein GCM10023156_10600 [Novipirellula rosea]|uniref:Uncharacterized protein n=2 Tax=Novipirellula rosea TaxID=1031540 RepID=A0ABP8MEC3_9BACT
MVSLDTATLSRVSSDFWAADSARRENSQTFVRSLTELGVHVVLSQSHLIELLRHENDDVVAKRLKFIQKLPLVASPRPYLDVSGAGSMACIATHELHAFIYDDCKDPVSICSSVREGLWQTGTGESYVGRLEDWNPLIHAARATIEQDRVIATVSRISPQCSSMPLGHFLSIKPVPKILRNHRFPQFTDKLLQSVRRNGDKRLLNPDSVAHNLATRTQARIDRLDDDDGDLVYKLLSQYIVPSSLLRAEMTLGGLGDLDLLARRLEVIGDALVGDPQVDLESVPPGTLPTLTLDLELTKRQVAAERVSGSDLGDGHLATLALYADVTEVDKRTEAYLRQIRNSGGPVSQLIGHTLKTTDYPGLVDQIARHLSS